MPTSMAKENPFKEYRFFVQANYPNHQYHFTVLSLDDVSKDIPDDFNNVLYQNLIKTVESKLLKHKDAQHYHLHYLFHLWLRFDHESLCYHLTKLLLLRHFHFLVHWRLFYSHYLRSSVKI